VILDQLDIFLAGIVGLCLLAVVVKLIGDIRGSDESS